MKQLIAITTLAAALLGGTAHAAGWYLLWPYYDVERPGFLPIPLSQWSNQGAYDSAQECEHASLVKQWEQNQRMPEALELMKRSSSTSGDPNWKENWEKFTSIIEVKLDSQY